MGKIEKKNSLSVHSKYSAILSKIHYYRLRFRRFCPLGRFLIGMEFSDYKTLYIVLLVMYCYCPCRRPVHFVITIQQIKNANYRGKAVQCINWILLPLNSEQDSKTVHFFRYRINPVYNNLTRLLPYKKKSKISKKKNYSTYSFVLPVVCLHICT